MIYKKVKQGEIAIGANWNSSAILIQVMDNYTQGDFDSAAAALSVKDALAVVKKLNKAIDKVKAAEGKPFSEVWRGKKEKD